MITFVEIQHNPQCVDARYMLMQKRESDGLWHRIKCQGCGAVGEPFPEKELAARWPMGEGVSNVTEKKSWRSRHGAVADRILDKFITESGKLIRESFGKANS